MEECKTSALNGEDSAGDVLTWQDPTKCHPTFLNCYFFVGSGKKVFKLLLFGVHSAFKHSSKNDFCYTGYLTGHIVDCFSFLCYEAITLFIL